LTNELTTDAIIDGMTFIILSSGGILAGAGLFTHFW